jgi:glycosyltransferase involved in cell wall biosynthesis
MIDVRSGATVIMFSTADWTAPYWTNKQHIAKRLSARGFRVLYVESPGLRQPERNARDLSRIFRRLRRALAPPIKINDMLWVFSPLTVPFAHKSTIVERFNGWHMRSVIRQWCKRNAVGNVIVWTYHPYIVGAIEDIASKKLVYHCVDDLAAIPGVNKEAFLSAEKKLVEAADIVFTTSPHLLDHCKSLGAKKCVFERNVADIAHFAKAREPGSIPPEIEKVAGPKLCYIGVLADYKLDLELIRRCVIARQDINWVFIGDEPERQASAIIGELRAYKNVHFLGHQSYEVLPDYLRGIDIAILPNLTDGYMRGVFPMKFYEYLASGKPLISTPLHSLTNISSPITMAQDPDEWLDAIDACLNSPPSPLALDDERLAQFDWEHRLDRMLHEIGG